jgi:hypothetical protein
MIYLKKVPEINNCCSCFFNEPKDIRYCRHHKWKSHEGIGCGNGEYIFVKATETEIIAYQKRTGNK